MTRALFAALCFLPALLAPAQPDKQPDGLNAPPTPPAAPSIEFKTYLHKASGTEVRIGTFAVFEDRDAHAGRQIHLEVVVLPATGERRPDPVFVLSGGPGLSSAAGWRRWAGHWMREHHDIVLVAQRGTDGDNKLACATPANNDNLQAYLDHYFDPARFRDCLEDLRQRYDLTKYSTPIAMDDLNDVRIALTYDKINLYGGSYASRAELVYIRRHPESVRTATLNSVVPISFTNPLYHARGVQDALDMIFDECAADPVYAQRFGDLRAKFAGVLSKLDGAPADAFVIHPETGEPVPVKLSRDAFAEALRFMMYTNIRDVPMIIDRASRGDLDLLAQRAVDQARALQGSLAAGMLLCVTCGEDIPRIDPDSIAPLTDGTFLGDGRVRRQMAVCDFWPRSDIPADYADPVHADVPVLLLSGDHDPVTPPRWGAAAAEHLPNRLHVIAPGTHGLAGPCIDSIVRAFLDAGTVEGLDTDCVRQIALPRYNMDH